MESFSSEKDESYNRDPGDLPIALRRQYKVVLPPQNDGFWLAQRLSRKHGSTALGAPRSKFYFCEWTCDVGWCYLFLFIWVYKASDTVQEPLLIFFLWWTCTMIERIQLFSGTWAKIRWREIHLTLSRPRVPYGTRRNYELSIWSICVKFAQPKDLWKIYKLKA